MPNINFFKCFGQFRELDTTLQFTFFLHTIQFGHFKLSHFDWLDLDDLEIEIVDYQESIVWKIIISDLNQKLEASKLNQLIKDSESIENRTENIILAE